MDMILKDLWLDFKENVLISSSQSCGSFKTNINNIKTEIILKKDCGNNTYKM